MVKHIYDKDGQYVGKELNEKEHNQKVGSGCLVASIFGIISLCYYTLKKMFKEMYTFSVKHPIIALPIIAFFLIDGLLLNSRILNFGSEKLTQIVNVIFDSEEEKDTNMKESSITEEIKITTTKENQIIMCEYCPDFPAEDGSSMCSACISEEDEMDGMGPDQSDMGCPENSWDLYASLKDYEYNIFEGETDNFRIRVDFLGDFVDSEKKEYRYASWPINLRHNEKPSLVLYSGELILTPNGGKYEFKNGIYKYTCTVKFAKPGELVVYKSEQELRRENFLK